MKIDGYVRVSRVGTREGPRFISPDVQEERIRAFALAGGHEILTIQVDLDQPGSRIDREGLQKALERIEAGESQGICVARLDRFARSAGDAANLVKRIRAAGGELLAAQESIDTSGPFGRFVVQILTAIGELELERIRENWATARSKAVARGVHVGGRVPPGLEKIDRGPDEGNLRANHDSATIHELFELRAGGHSWVKLARFLEHRGVVTPWGNEHWTVASVKSIIRNRVYLGEIHAGAGLVNRTALEPLVSAELFARANAARGVMPPRSGRSAGLLSGILRCAGCSYAMKVSSGSTRHGKTFREYRCKPDKAGGRCDCPTSAKAERVESYVVERFLAEAGDMTAVGIEVDDELASAERRLDIAKTQLAAVLSEDLAAVLEHSRDEYLDAVRERQLAVDDARRQLDAVRLRRPQSEIARINLAETWPDLALEEQRQLIASAVDAIFLRRPLKDPRSLRARLFICWRGEGPPLPVRGQRSTIRPFDGEPASAWEPLEDQPREGRP